MSLLEKRARNRKTKKNRMNLSSWIRNEDINVNSMFLMAREKNIKVYVMFMCVLCM